MSGRNRVAVGIYGCMAVFQFMNIGLQFVNLDSRIGNWINSFPNSAQYFVLASSTIIGGALWPITLPVMIVRDMKDEKNRRKKD